MRGVVQRVRAADPGLMFTSTSVRMFACMAILFGLPYLVGPWMGMTHSFAVGAAGGMMGVIPQLLPAQARRDAVARCAAAFAGSVVAAVIMTLLSGMLFAQAIFFVPLLALPVIAARFHKVLGGAAVQGMIGSALMCMMVGYLVGDPWRLLGQYVVLTGAVMAVMCPVVTGLVRRPPEVVRQAKRSLLAVHRQEAARFAAVMREPSPRRLRALGRSVDRGHRCAIAIEAAMAATPSLPVRACEALHHSAFDCDLTFTRLARIAERIAFRPELADVRRRIAEVFDLLVGRGALELALATELAAGLREYIERVDVDAETSNLLARVPRLTISLIAQLVDGGVAGAEISAALSENPGVARRAGWDAWVPASSGLHAQIVEGEHESFDTGVDYIDLAPAGEGSSAAATVGEREIGRIALGLAERQALQTLIAVAVASVIGALIAGVHFFWASFGAFVVLIGTTTTSSRLRKTIRRVAGSAVGALLGLALAWLVGGAHPLVELAAMIILAAIAFTVLKRSYWLFSAFLTATIMQIYVITAAPVTTYALLRVADNAVGAVVAGLVASVILPLHTSSVVATVLAQVADGLSELFDEVTDTVEGKASARPRAAARKVEARARRAQALAASMLGPFAGTSATWVRGVSARVPVFITSVTELATTAGEISDHVSAPGGDEDAESILGMIAQVRARACLLSRSEPGGEAEAARAFAPSAAVPALTASLHARIDRSDTSAGPMLDLVVALVRLDAATRELIRAAWDR